MKRRHMIAGLIPAAAAAQSAVVSTATSCMYDGASGRLLNPGCENITIHADGSVTMNTVEPRIVTKPKPANNECPVCGTMAPAHKSQRFTKPKPCASGVTPATLGIACVEVIKNPQEQNLVRCAHCNAAFWQDGE